LPGLRKHGVRQRLRRGQAGVHAGLTPSQTLANAVFAQTGQRAVRDVWVGGQARVVNGRHVLDADAQAAFVAARSQLLAEA